MLLIKPDHDHRVEIPGVPKPVLRPVDINSSKTAFSTLRTLRIYHFDRDSVVNGHAEEDEVMLVVLAGSIELTIHEENSGNAPLSTTLAAPATSANLPCVAYFPPGSAYKLIASGEAEVAYARATPSTRRASRLFSTTELADLSPMSTILEDIHHAERLRLRIVRIAAHEKTVSYTPTHQSESGPESDDTCETLIHICGPHFIEGVVTLLGADKPSTSFRSGDTLALSPGERPVLHLAPGPAGFLLIVMAS